MQVSLRLVLVLLVATAVGCGDPATNTDASGDVVSGDVVMMSDVQMMMGDATADRPSTSDTPSGDAGGGGTCGRAVVTCMCMCGMNATCQTNCVNGSMTCGMCVVQAQLDCCPTEGQTFGACALAARDMASDAGPACGTDTACIARRCATEFAAFNTCFANAQQTSTMCQTRLGTCFGSFPIMCN